MKWSITAKIACFAAVALILLSLIGALVYQRTLEQMDAGRRLAHAQRVLTELEATSSLIKDLEIGERSYGITGNPLLLKPYLTAMSKMDSQLDRLSLLNSDNDAQNKRTGDLREAIKKRIEFASHVIALRKAGSDKAASREIVSQAEQALNDQVFDLIEAMQSEERLLVRAAELLHRTASEKVMRDLALFVLVIATILSLIFLSVRQYESERAKTEAIQRAIGLKFSGVFNQSSETIFLLDPEGKILQANETGLRLVGARREDVVGLPYWETKWCRGASEQKDRLKQAVTQAVNGAVVRFETQYQTVDGGLIDIDFSLKPLKDEAGQTVFLIAEGHELTDFKRAERAVQESESRLRAIFANMGEGLYQLDAAGRLVYLNPAGAKMLGYEMLDIVGCNMHELIHSLLPDGTEHAASDCPILNVIKVGVAHTSRDDFFVCRDGSFLPVRILSSPLVIDGQVKGAVVSFEDITALKRADRRSTTQYSVTRALAQSDSVGEAAAKVIESICVNIGWDVGTMWLYDDSAKRLRFIKMWHGRALELEGFEQGCREQEAGDPLSSHGNAFSENAPLWISRNDREHNPYFLSVAARNGLNTAFAFPIRNEDTCIGVIELYSLEVQEPNIELLHMLDALGRQFGQFIERKRVEQRLKESEELFSQLADNIKEVFWVATPNLDRCLFVSPAYQEVWGFSREEIFKNPAVYLRSVVKEDRQRVTDHVKPENMGVSGSAIEYRMIGADGGVRWIWSRAFPIKDEFGNVVRLCGIAHDITERKEVEKRVSEFYSTVSHELRTPLTSIRASLGLIEGGLAGPITQKTAQLTQIARSESDRLIRLINDILDIRKIEAGRLELKREEVLPAELVSITLDGVRAMATESGISLVSEVNVNYNIACDRDRVVQVLTNLMSNAIKFSPRGSTVFVAVEPTDHRVRFSVSDAGPGIPEDQRHRLFGLFQQLDSSDSRPKGGTGLGLAISKAIVEQHAGEIGVDSGGEQGSTFWFELPAPVAQIIAGDLLGQPRRDKILLVEDDVQLTQLLRVLLAHDGYEVTVANNLNDASKILKRLSPQAVILDVQLPDGNGLDWMKSVRASGVARDVPMIVLTERAPELDKYGHPLLIDWLNKPFDEKRLLKALHLAVRKRSEGMSRRRLFATPFES
jgi:PAS domain S-box-containing protein